MGGMREYEDFDALGLARLVREREVSAREVLEEAIARAQAVNPRINALVARMFDAARASADAGSFDGPFAGVPFLAKDLGPALAGAPLTHGSAYFREYVPVEDHEFFKRVKRAGLNVFGKTNAPEFGLMPYTEPRLHGVCRNPWNLERTPGGSSGGSAALVAAGVVPMAHANDMGGSIRIPASCCGLFGLKPTRGRMPVAGGAVGDANVDLCVSRSVRDSAALLDAVALENTFLDAVTREPKKLRIAVAAGAMLGKAVHPECRAAVDRAAELCAQLGHDVTIDEPAGIDYSAVAMSVLLIFATQIGWLLRGGNPLPGKRLRAGDLEPASWAMLTIAQTLSAAELADALGEQRRLAHILDDFMQRYDVLITPTLAAPPVRIGELALTKGEIAQIEVLARLRSGALIRKAATEIAKTMFDWVAFTPIFNLTGQPAMSVPLHLTGDGLPVGVQFAARLGDDATLLALAGQLERAVSWDRRRPAPL